MAGTRYRRGRVAGRAGEEEERKLLESDKAIDTQQQRMLNEKGVFWKENSQPCEIQLFQLCAFIVEMSIIP
eukprot:763072-Hanusia_phi.AAC.6